MFIGRRNELSDLRTEFDSPTSSLVVIYGRRRVGKSTLIKEAAEGRPFVYFQATQDAPHLSITAFKAAVETEIGIDPVLFGLQDWESILHHLAQLAAGDLPSLVVVLDEFPYLCEAYPPLPSVIQKFWDSGAANKGRLKLVLCGSVISSMEKLISSKEPLYGRQTATYDIEPMPLRDIAAFLPGYSALDLIATYAVFGGIPYYLEKCSGNCPPEENILNLLLSRNGALIGGPEILTQSEVNEPTVYHSILAAIAAGKTKRGEIRDCVRSRGDIGGYLEKLAKMHVAMAMKSIDADPFSRDNRYAITDPMTAFWYGFVRPNMSAIRVGHGKTVWDARIRPALGWFMGNAVETLCRQHVSLNGHEFLPSPVRSVGKLWRKSDYDIDIAGELIDGSHIYGEVKWTRDAVGVPVLSELVDRAKISAYGGLKGRHFILFSKSGFTDGLHDHAASDPSVILVETQDLAFAR